MVNIELIYLDKNNKPSEYPQQQQLYMKSQQKVCRNDV